MQHEMPSEHVLKFIENNQGVAAVAWKKPGGGYTEAQRWIVTLANGRTLFAKAAVDPLTAGWLKSELRIYTQVQASYLAELIAFEDQGEFPILLLEDLSRGDWPHPGMKAEYRK